MDNIYVGKIVGTHGIKGELKIISDFQYKDKIFVIGNHIMIDNKEYLIRTYRHHKIYELVTLDQYNDINEVEFLKNKKVYISKASLELNDNEVLDSDLLEFDVCYNDLVGRVLEVFDAGANNKVMRVSFLDKEVLIPFNSPMLQRIDKKEKKIYLDLIEGMI